MPLNLAVFDPDKASEVITTFPKVINWVVGGHALGGSMAAMLQPIIKMRLKPWYYGPLLPLEWKASTMLKLKY